MSSPLSSASAFSSTALLECVICGDTSRYDNVEGFVQCRECSSAFCMQCYQTYLVTKINDGLVLPSHLVCPGEACGVAVTMNDLEFHLPPETLRKFQTFFASSEHRARGGLFCPRTDCGAPIPVQTKESLFFKRRVDCNVCHKRSCLRCGDDYHRLPRATCNDKLYKKWVKATKSQQCPNCRFTIEKNGGCNHVACSQCHYEFDWASGRPWSKHGQRSLLGTVAHGAVVTGIVALEVVVLLAVVGLGLPCVAGYQLVRACRGHRESKGVWTMYVDCIRELVAAFLGLDDDE